MALSPARLQSTASHRAFELQEYGCLAPDFLWAAVRSYTTEKSQYFTCTRSEDIEHQMQYVRGDIYRAAIERAEKAEAALEDK